MKKISLIRYNILFVLLLIIVLILVGFLDYKRVKLEYIDSLKVKPHLYDLLIKKKKFKFDEWEGIFTSWRGEGVKEKSSLEAWLRDYKEGDNAIVDWNEIIYEDNQIYYACVGCKLEGIRYFYHSRYFNVVNNPSIFAINSISMKPVDESVINIYIGDVVVSDIYGW
ncbi:MAG: hypothetical protein OEV42_21280 [Deltaproteobacteria bacterium]|nr:hypothetical protein [Deltaproteobacteria bacterium]